MLENGAPAPTLGAADNLHGQFGSDGGRQHDVGRGAAGEAKERFVGCGDSFFLGEGTLIPTRL